MLDDPTGDPNRTGAGDGTTNPTPSAPDPSSGFWAVVELMGHVRMGGFVTEEERFGAKIGRVEVPGTGDSWVTVWFGGGSIYRVTAVREGVARAVAARSQPQPVHSWEMPEGGGAAGRAPARMLEGRTSGLSHGDEDDRDPYGDEDGHDSDDDGFYP